MVATAMSLKAIGVVLLVMCLAVTLFINKVIKCENYEMIKGLHIKIENGLVSYLIGPFFLDMIYEIMARAIFSITSVMP